MKYNITGFNLALMQPLDLYEVNKRICSEVSEHIHKNAFLFLVLFCVFGLVRAGGRDGDCEDAQCVVVIACLPIGPGYCTLVLYTGRKRC